MLAIKDRAFLFIQQRTYLEFNNLALSGLKSLSSEVFVRCVLLQILKLCAYIGIARKTDYPRFRAGTVPTCVCCETDDLLWQTTFLQQLTRSKYGATYVICNMGPTISNYRQNGRRLESDTLRFEQNHEKGRLLP